MTSNVKTSRHRGVRAWLSSRSKRRVAVLKNNLTEAEMDEVGKAWLNHKGPYLTVAESIALAAERAKQRSAISE